MSFNRFDLAGLALAAAGALTLQACIPSAQGRASDAPPPLPTYALDVLEVRGGEVYADTVDHGMSALDCMARREPYTLESGVCAIEAAPSGSRLPYLVGLDCEGFAGPVYGNDESDFPLCGAIGPTGAQRPA